MTRPPVAVLDYGVGNLHSAAKALDRAGAEVRVVPTVAEAAGAAGLVVPGVGAYGACLNGLASAGGAAAVAGWLEGGRPLLGICVGMQLLFEASEEGPVGDGLGMVPGKIRHL
ncbi:MAG TPA: imidazole glycerol phosphate synthase subunit HisH, partial [Actinomycetes bacterium]|nr:imidazole glycerol phosphate synthase subunit HisH [Actinomycetes bacterium]